jgi:hypothetical protein
MAAVAASAAAGAAAASASPAAGSKSAGSVAAPTTPPGVKALALRRGGTGSYSAHEGVRQSLFSSTAAAGAAPAGSGATQVMARQIDGGPVRGAEPFTSHYPLAIALTQQRE